MWHSYSAMALYAVSVLMVIVPFSNVGGCSQSTTIMYKGDVRRYIIFKGTYNGTMQYLHWRLVVSLADPSAFRWERLPTIMARR